MNKHEMHEALKEAAAIVDAANLPDDLRQAAFVHVLNSLTGAPSPRVTRGGGRKLRVTRTRQPSSKKTAAVRKPKRIGPRTLTSELVDEGFFDEAKVLSELQDELIVRGHNYRQQALSPALLALTQDKTLRRERRKDEGDRDVWAYKKSK